MFPVCNTPRITDGACDEVQGRLDECVVANDAATVHHVSATVEGPVHQRRAVVVRCEVRLVGSDVSSGPYEKWRRDKRHDDEEQIEVDFEEPAQEEEIRQHTAAEVTCNQRTRV